VLIVAAAYKEDKLDCARLADKQARGLILGNQASKGGACLLVYCLYIVNCSSGGW
jgi:hypothetical protein